jgi:hypothetical protein
MAALMANVGTLMLKKTGSLALEALAQAASNTLLAHIVSLAFLMVMTKKITQAYQKVRAELAECGARAGEGGPSQHRRTRRSLPSGTCLAR